MERKNETVANAMFEQQTESNYSLEVLESLEILDSRVPYSEETFIVMTPFAVPEIS